MWNFFDTRARRMGILDTKLAQGAALFFGLALAKLIPEILAAEAWVYFLLAFLFALKPIMTIFGDET